MGWWFEKQCYRFADLVVTVSPGQRDNILSRYPNLNLKVIPNASDNELFGVPSSGQMPNFLRGKKLLTHIGSLGRIHNIEYWLDVAKVIQCKGAKDIHFVFIGEGANRSDLERRVSDLTLANVSFLGLKPKKDLPVWVQHSVATLFATTSNPVQDTCSPNKVFDSFAAGKPIIQTSTGWIKELVKTEQCGINIELNNIRASAEKVIKYVNSPEKLKEHAAHSKRLAERTFDREKLALNYLYWLYQEFNQER
jgi:glycosyltransferase involved in cell wall biosynthesis